MITIAPGVVLDEEDVVERFVQASGPGGQHVNKNATAVQLQLDVNAASGIPQAVKTRLVKLAGKRMSPEGLLTIHVQTHRSQYRNRAEAWERLVELIRKATVKPKPRRATKPTRASKKRRVESKRRRSQIKTSRGKVREDD